MGDRESENESAERERGSRRVRGWEGGRDRERERERERESELEHKAGSREQR